MKRYSLKLSLSLIFMILYLFTFGNQVVSSQELEERVAAEGFDTVWEMIWGPDDYIWVTERIGKISRVNPESGEVFLIGQTPDVYETSELGLMGMVLHPDFENTPHVFVVYTRKWKHTDHLYPNEAVVERFTYEDDTLINPTIIMERIPVGSGTHAGARLLIDDDMTMYITMGDGRLGGGTYKGDLAQDLTSLNGKVLRMNLDGSVPEDNPFYGMSSRNNFIWSWGHRNPQGLVKANGYLYSSEHGPNTNDEFNIIEKNRNYGWPDVNGFCTTDQEKEFCEDNNVKEPLSVYYEKSTLAVCGIDYYNNKLLPEWQNSVLMATLKSSTLVQIKLSNDGLEVVESNEYFKNNFGRLRDVLVAPDGRVFIGTSNWDAYGDQRDGSDKIIELKPKGNSVKKNDIRTVIYPNPSNGKININSDERILSYQVYDQFGSMLIENKYKKSLDLGLGSGVYFIKFQTLDGYFTERIIINK